MRISKKEKKNIIVVTCVALAVLLVGGMAGMFKGHGGDSINFEDVTTLSGSTSVIYTDQILVNAGSDNAVTFTVDAENAGIYEVLMKPVSGDTTRAKLENVTYDAKNELISGYISSNVEDKDNTYLNGFSKYAYYVNLCKGENTLQFTTLTGSLAISEIKVTPVTGTAYEGLINLASGTSDVYTESSKVEHSGTYGTNTSTKSVVLLGGEEYSDSYQHTFTVDKSGSFSLGMFAAGDGTATVVITAQDGEIVAEFTTARSISNMADTVVNGARSGSTAFVDLGERCALKAGVNYTVKITTDSYINYAGLVAFSK